MVNYLYKSKVTGIISLKGFFFWYEMRNFYLTGENNKASWITNDSMKDGQYSIQVTKESISLAYAAKVWAGLLAFRLTCKESKVRKSWSL